MTTATALTDPGPHRNRRPDLDPPAPGGSGPADADAPDNGGFPRPARREIPRRRGGSGLAFDRQTGKYILR